MFSTAGRVCAVASLVALTTARSSATIPAEPTERPARALVRGSPDPGDPAVGIVAIGGGKLACLAALVSPNFVLTGGSSAECPVNDPAPKTFHTRLGSFTAHPVIHVFNHPTADFVLLELETPITDVAPVDGQGIRDFSHDDAVASWIHDTIAACSPVCPIGTRWDALLCSCERVCKLIKCPVGTRFDSTECDCEPMW